MTSGTPVKGRGADQSARLAVEFTADPARRVFFTTALDALEARTGAVDGKLQSSGVRELEQAIADSCQHDRRRVKLGKPGTG